jgi:hypothetical protein
MSEDEFRSTYAEVQAIQALLDAVPDIVGLPTAPECAIRDTKRSDRSCTRGIYLHGSASAGVAGFLVHRDTS